jgi:tRNA(adenine34) deaminase
MSGEVPLAIHEAYMRLALAEARRAEAEGEVPIGAVLVAGGEVVGRGFNRPIGSLDPTAHAELVALRAAAQQLRNYRLVEVTAYVTLEPCLMCVGALLNARVAAVVYGAPEPKWGAVRSLVRLDELACTHRFDVRAGVLEDECRQLMVDFFRFRRGGA